MNEKRLLLDRKCQENCIHIKLHASGFEGEMFLSLILVNVDDSVNLHSLKNVRDKKKWGDCMRSI